MSAAPTEDRRIQWAASRRSLLGDHRKAALALALVCTSILVAGCDRSAEVSRGSLAGQGLRVMDSEIRLAVDEKIDSRKITPAGGYGYYAELTGKVPGVRDGGDGRKLRLVEDERSLGPTGALSADVESKGGGRYNHEIASAILFSTSDNSDPRTNGRAYRVEWDAPAPVVARSFTCALGLGANRCLVDASRGRPLRNHRLVVENLDPKRAVRIWGHRDGWPDLTTTDAMVASVIRPGMSEEEKAIALWTLVTTWRHHDVAAAAGVEAASPSKLIGVYGFGFCNDVADALATLLERAGLRSRVSAWDQHTVAEAHFDGQWHLLDPDRGRVYRTKSGRLASVADVFARRISSVDGTSGAVPLASENLDTVYPRDAERVSRRPLSDIGHDLRPILEPRDAVVFEFGRGEHFVDRFSFERPPGWPTLFGNGWLRRTIGQPEEGGCRLARLRWPYPIVAAIVQLRGLPSGESLSVQVRSGEKEAWEGLRVDRVGGDALSDASAWVQRQHVLYGLHVRVCGDGGGFPPEAVEALLEAVFQFAPRTIQGVSNGATSFDWTVESAPSQDPSSTTFAGAQVTYEWEEIETSSMGEAPPGSFIFNLEPNFISPDGGFGFTTPLAAHLGLGIADGIRLDAGSVALVLYENGRELGPGSESHAMNRERGRGRFSHWGGVLFFAASDNTDPRSNGRIYSVGLKPRRATDSPPESSAGSGRG